MKKEQLILFDSKPKKIRFLDLCSGIGGGRLGLEKSGFECVAFSEILPKSIAVYRDLFDTSNEKFLGDLTTTRLKDIPDAEMLIAGFPCQTFSIVGKRKGFNDSRGQIIFHIAKILKTKQIKYFLLENVKGLTNHDKGKSLQTILELLESSGYKVFHKVLKTNDFDIPQKRERIYFVGIRKDLPYSSFEFPKPKQKTKELKDFLIEENSGYEITDLSTINKYLENKYNKDKYDLTEILQNDFLIVDTRQSDIRFFKEYIPTLRTGRSGILYVKNKKLRKISGYESLLLQGFDSNIYDKTKKYPDSLLLQQTGNAMSVNVIYAISEQLKILMKKNGDI